MHETTPVMNTSHVGVFHKCGYILPLRRQSTELTITGLVMNNSLETLDIRRWREEEGFAKRAELELGETPEVKAKSLKEIKELLRAQSEFRPRMEDDYLVRFLRAKKFDVDKAYKLLRNFYRCRLIAPDKFAPIGVGPRDLKNLYDLRVGLILPHRNPIDGTVIVIAQFGDWTPETGYVPMDSYTPVAMAFDHVQRNPEVQLYGFRLVINLLGLEWRYLQFLHPTVLRALQRSMQDGYPARFKGAHIVNNSYIYNVIYNIVKPFINEKVRSRVHLHASAMETLHEFISPEILPEEYGGTAPPATHHWFAEELYERHDEYVKNSFYGYDERPPAIKRDKAIDDEAIIENEAIL